MLVQCSSESDLDILARGPVVHYNTSGLELDDVQPNTPCGNCMATSRHLYYRAAIIDSVLWFYDQHHSSCNS